MAEKEPEVHGVSLTQFNLWKHNPVTELVMRYLADYRSVVVREMVGSWEDGRLTISEEHEMRGRVLAVRELTELEHAAIVQFYAEPGEDEDVDRLTDAQAHQD